MSRFSGLARYALLALALTVSACTDTEDTTVVADDTAAQDRSEPAPSPNVSLETPASITTPSTLVGQWIFKGPNGSLDDRTGHWDDVQLNRATLDREGLHVSGSGWALASGYRGPEFRDRTLIAWVRMQDLGDGSPGGGPIAIEGLVLNDDDNYYRNREADGAYDGIVFGELVANTWMAGSDNHRRTIDRKQQARDNPKTTQPGETVKIAITYEWNPSGTFLKIYKDDQLTSDHFPHTRVPTFGGDSAHVLFGPRHTEGGMGSIPVGFVNATILGAEIHNAALSADQLAERKIDVTPAPPVTPPPPTVPVDLADISCDNPSLQPTNSEISADDQVVILAMHNRAREAVGNTTIVWDDQLAKHAQGWADVIAERNRLEDKGISAKLPGSMGVHSDRSCYSKSYGYKPENISPGSATVANAIQMWVDEQQNWTEQQRKCVQGTVCEHYLQVVAEFVTKVGCGHNASSSWICSYDQFGAMQMADQSYREPYKKNT